MADFFPRLTRLAPGIYADGHGGCHVDLEELLEASGYADTPANRKTLLEAAERIGRETGCPVTIETHDIHREDPTP